MYKFEESIALWLSYNSYLTDRQISRFCNITELDLKRIISQGDESSAVNPINMGIITQDDINSCQEDENLDLPKHKESDLYAVHSVSRSKEVHNEHMSAILWVLRKNINVDSTKLAKTLKVDSSLVDSIKKRKSLKIPGVTIKSPFSLGLCTKEEQRCFVN